MEAPGEALFERDRELDVLRGLLRQARAGEGRLALVEGGAGIGKTALVGAARALAGDDGFAVLAARGAELEGEYAFGLVRQLFEPALDRLASREREEVLAGAAALSERALGLLTRGDEPDTLAGLHGLYWLCANLAERTPLLLAVDDAHWGDLPSLRWLCYLARRLEGVPLLMLVATRPGAPDSVGPFIDALRREPGVCVIVPAPLSQNGVRALVEGTFGVAPADEFVQACHEQSAGNPLLARELTRALVGDGETPDATAARRLLALPPREALRTVLVRLGRLPGAASALARAVAVLGTDVSVRDAAALAGLDGRVAGEAADSLATAGILAPGTSLRFVHPLLRSAVYDDIPAARRAGDHARAAELLRTDRDASERVTAHLLACEPTGEDWATAHLRSAARTALARGASETAVTVLERCLAQRPAPAVRAAVVRELGMAERRIAPERAIEHLTDAHESTSDVDTRIAIARELAAAMLGCARATDAYELLERTLAEVPGNRRELVLAVEAEVLSIGLWSPALAARVKDRVAHLPALPGHTAGERLVLANVARHLDQTGAPVPEAAAIAKRAIADGQLLFDQTPDSVTFVVAVAVLIRAGDLETARELCSGAVADAQRRGSPVGTALASTVLSYAEWWRGDLRAAESAAQTGLDLCRQVGFLFIAPVAVRVLVEVAIERGQLDHADAVLVANDFAGDIPGTFFAFGLVLFERGALRLAQGRSDDGIADLIEFGARELAAGYYGTQPWRAALVPALAANGETARAQELAGEELGLARRRAAPAFLGRALRALGNMAGGSVGLDHLREAADLLAPTQYRLEYAHALTDLGAALRRANQRTNAREYLRHGMDLAHRCGATVLTERARQELLATGARQRSLVLTGVDSLTASERRVAELAAQGMTNKQIAQALFVTHKTVETHLGHAYAKLDINSRTGLPAALSAIAEPAPGTS